MERRFAYAPLIAVIMASSQAAFAGGLTPKVVVTVEPLKPYVDAILDGATQATSLLRAGQDPHTMTLSPVQAKALAEADIVIMPDASINPTLARVFEKKKHEGAVLIELTQLRGANPIGYAQENPWLETKKKSAGDEEEDAHADTVPDPHIWLDPIRMADMAGPLANALGKAAPDYQKHFIFNAGRLAYHLRHDVDPAIRDLLEKKKGPPTYNSKPFVPFVTYHEAYQYFLTRYGITQAGFITKVPDELMGARSIHDAQVRARAVNIRCVISESDTAIAKRIADVSSARLVVMNPERTYSSEEVGIAPWMQNDYDRLLYKVATTFAGCL